MSAPAAGAGSACNVALYPWFKALMNLNFWQAVWFLYFQSTLSAAAAVLLYAVYDVATTVLEVPSGYMSDRLGRRATLIASSGAGCAGAALLALGGGFAVLAAGQVLIGASAAFASGTDSALLYELLAATGRQGEIEREELRAWRFTFGALALSAVAGGVLVPLGGALPFVAGAAAFAGAGALALRFAEPPRTGTAVAEGAEVMRLGSLRAALTQPVLIWLFVLTVVMYVFSHVPFVFGQPFILEALKGAGLAAGAPVVSGSVSAVMMGLSVAVSVGALRLRRRLGLPAILLASFAMQIALISVLALTNGPLAILFLLFRMVPNALSRPFITARIQPLLGGESRATYFSLQSLVGRMIFAATLYLASFSTSGVGQMAYGEIRRILGWYVLGGLVCLAALALAGARVGVERTAEA